MKYNLLDLRLPAEDRWKKVLKKESADKWVEVFREFDAEAGAIVRPTVKAWGVRMMVVAMSAAYPYVGSYLKELKGITKYLGVDYDVALAGQLLYDAVTAGVFGGVCGCTSMAMLHDGRPWHGRLLDWAWPESLKDGVMKVQVVGCKAQNLTLEMLPGLVGSTGGHTRRMAANLNQAPVSALRKTKPPALLWFRDVLENGRLSFGMYPKVGGMSDCLLHVTDCRGTAVVQYAGGKLGQVAQRALSDKPVVLTNSMPKRMNGESKAWFDWSKERRIAVEKSKAKSPTDRLFEAACECSIHAWKWAAP